ncbi:hypothetical protein [Frondihabitans australicus]|uniref:Uncharacterized protein n=1 Tax=Frondihabitans australicus TaxID=386892 RepID=A0A495IFU2_9MICO|nr:hypothetical protein [Frondihabitans australicus]RKR74883.1 hypothetical protein C8E83_2017 [Frondihabitans australicus]
MELLFAALGGALLGFIFHYALPGQETRGVLWSAAFGTCAAIVVWEALVWAGMGPGDGWIWVIDLVVAALAAAGITRLSTVRRRAADRELLERLFKGEAA